jgi:hypothetical protein
MDKELILKVKGKKIFSELPDGLIWRFLEKNNLEIKETRADLRKFFGVFLTNRVLKGVDKDILKSHISSKGRDYLNFYNEIFGDVKGIKSVIDLGCGANGFSYSFLEGVLGNINYHGVEAAGQLVKKMNDYFDLEGFGNAGVVNLDLFEKEKVLKILSDSKSPKVVMLLQVIDALENLKKDYSKELLLGLKDSLESKDLVVISMPLKSISGRKKFEVRRTWLKEFLERNFLIERDFNVGDERVFLVRKD